MSWTEEDELRIELKELYLDLVELGYQKVLTRHEARTKKLLAKYTTLNQ